MIALRLVLPGAEGSRLLARANDADDLNRGYLVLVLHRRFGVERDHLNPDPAIDYT